MKNKFFVLVLAIITVSFLAPVVFTGETFFIRDIITFFAPQQLLVNEVVQRGDVPLWNPYGYMGMPLLATWQSRIFSPMSIPFYLFGLVTGMKIFHFLAMFLAGMFCYIFLRNQKMSMIAALTGSALWMLNGYFITKFEFFSQINVLSFAFAPFCFVSSNILAAIALCIAFLGGHTVFFLIFVVYCGLVLLDGRYKNIFATTALFLALAAVQMVPTMELIMNSHRAKHGIEPGVAYSHSLGINELKGIVVPKTEEKYAGARYHWNETLYIGFISFILLIVGASLKSGLRHKYWWCLLAFVGVILALGRNTPAYRFLYEYFYPFKVVRYPALMIFFFAIGATVLAAAGVDFLKYSKIQVVILVAVVAELFFRGYKFLETAKPDLFYITPPPVEYIRKTPFTRFALTPKTHSSKMVRGKTIQDAWLNIRTTLKGFTSWPYRIFNAYGYGEPLTLEGTEKLIDGAYSKKTPDDAYENYDNMGVGYLLSNTILEKSSNYRVLNSEPPFVYATKKEHPIFCVVDEKQKTKKAVYPADFSENKIVFIIDAGKQPKKFVHLENHYPSWFAYINGKKSKIARYGEFFKSVEIKNSINKLVLLYNPVSFNFGLYITIAAVLGSMTYLFDFIFKRQI